MSEQELQRWETRRRDTQDQALRTLTSALDDLHMLQNWSRRTPNYEVECMCGRRLSVRTKADEAHERRTNELTMANAELARLRAESAHRRDALHHAWAERDRLRVQLAELRAWRAAAAEDPDGDHHYLSTACEHELHERCRLRCKFCATGCVCPCHRAETPDYSVPGDHHDNVCERRSGHEWPFCRCKDRAEVLGVPTPADRGPLTPHPPPWPVDEP